MTAHELMLRYEADGWRATGAGIEFRHPELRGLEALIGAAFVGANAPVAVELRFDMTALPRWLHQYHAHYLNYTLRVPPHGACL